jgi:N4-gp56 family major capsid protein
MARQYNTGGSTSDIGATQLRDFHFQKKALIEAKKEMYFGQLADVTSMPKHMGKKIKRYHYLPLLDDANINDQGIDAAGLTANQKVSIGVTTVDGSIPNGSPFYDYSVGTTRYITGEGVDAEAAEDAAILKVNTWIESAVSAGGLGALLTTPGTADANFDEYLTTGGTYDTGKSAFDSGYRFVQPDGTAITGGVVAAGDLEAQAVMEAGNLWGSSKDVGAITGKLPLLSETGGRVNRVGFRRVELEGSLEKLGFFDEYTQESLDFDTDSELMMHVNREMINGASEITETNLQIDLLNSPGVVRFGGIATQTSELTGEGANISVPSYEDLMRLSIDLDNNRTPKHTTMITGTRMVDTKTVQAARFMYIGSELIPTVKKMKDIAGGADGSGFVSVEKYAQAGNVARGEIGQIDQFKIIVVPEMLHWAGAGGDVTTNTGYRESGGKYDVFPMLVVGDKSFTTIGFQTDGKTVKFKIKHSKPGDNISYSKDDPYGEMGFMSIKWYYGFMVLRPERIAVVKTVAEY